MLGAPRNPFPSSGRAGRNRQDGRKPHRPQPRTPPQDRRGEQRRVARRHLRSAPDSKEYARDLIDSLLFSGLFVPMLDVHCSSCRVESQVSARDLDATIRCDFCGEEFRLALSLSISSSKGNGATASRGTSAPEGQGATASPRNSVTFRPVPLRRRPDVVTRVRREGRTRGPRTYRGRHFTYLGKPNFLTVLGEVKTSNRVDKKDVRNLEDLQMRLSAKKVRSLLLFATLKDEFGPAEVKVLRELVERSTTAMTAHGALVPRFPLVLTGKDLSLPWSHDEHPWRWDEDRSHQEGLFGTAIQSCRRNLGLLTSSEANQANRPATCSGTTARPNRPRTRLHDRKRSSPGMAASRCSAAPAEDSSPPRSSSSFFGRRLPRGACGTAGGLGGRHHGWCRTRALARTR